VGTQQPYEDYEPPRGIWSRVKERVFGLDEMPDDEHEELPAHESRRRNSIRIDSARGVKVAVRLNASVFNDARIAADGLKGGQQQIVNLERATPQMSERIIDFLNGVTYALDGSVEKIGERVYLFAPANVQVEMDSGTETR
jgi:cell division inhibitor SepF